MRVETRHRAVYRTRRALAPAWALVVLGGAIGAFAGGALRQLGFSVAAGAVLALSVIAAAATAELDRPHPRFRVAARAAGAGLVAVGALVIVGRARGLPWVPLIAAFVAPLAPCWIRAVAAERELPGAQNRAAVYSRAFSRAAFGVIQFYGAIVMGTSLLGLAKEVARRFFGGWRVDQFVVLGAVLGAAAVISLRNAGRTELSLARGLKGPQPRFGPPRRLAVFPAEPPDAGDGEAASPSAPTAPVAAP